MQGVITKAVFPVAGLGSRFLPATKANPKEMLPIVDKPLIQYAVEEAIAAGITDLIFVTSSSKHAIEDYFDTNFELETRLANQNKSQLLAIIRNILPPGINCIYIRQAQPRGLGDAVLRAMPIIGAAPFAVLLADDLMDCPKQGCLQQMCEIYAKTQQSVIAVEEIAASQAHKYGVVALKEGNRICSRIAAIVEKPRAEDAPSNLGVAGRYILNPAIFSCLEKTPKGAGGEIQLTDAISFLLRTEDVYALQFMGKRYDCGSKLGYLQATVTFALKHPEFAEEFREYLLDVCKM
jgi:UTP--glucose-1-phosphate uridylyltransferase